ncbi:cysteine-rich receptor-like protein kinase 2 [Hibiscus syriacus]|uniref:cysteine-rich receptor-like protein kinase 2 n=1 Tax=Hibiscus syriacus TaxID=106335 RepID=UPI0019246867|nr:cysteine-rich receptor-like protein kinase 2 [Hibiscus syriacus]
MHFAVAQETTGSDPVSTMVQCSLDETVSLVSLLLRRISEAAPPLTVPVSSTTVASSEVREQHVLPAKHTRGTPWELREPVSIAADYFRNNSQKAIRESCKGDSFFAANSEEVVGVNGNVTAYGVAQCMQTIDETGSKACLDVALANIRRCPPDSDGRAVDTGCFLRYSDSPFFPANYTVDLRPFLGTIAEDVEGPPELQGPMTYKELNFATSNFSQQNKSGEGFGEVYKNGRAVAVKKLAIGTAQVKAEFHTEVKLISNVHRRNLVRLVGCCSKGPELLLAYEFMPNGSLDKHLFGEGHGSLNRKQIYHIILEKS